jgi:hypothetical protein
MKQSSDFPDFQGWEEGYAAFTYSYKEKDMLINYIKNQHKHHQKENTESELKHLWMENSMEPDSIQPFRLSDCEYSPFPQSLRFIGG